LVSRAAGRRKRGEKKGPRKKRGETATDITSQEVKKKHERGSKLGSKGTL